MTLETKKELLRYNLLNQRFGYEIELYNLLTWGKMKNEIARINELTFSCTVDLKNNEISAKQFLLYINEFIRCMKESFYNMVSFQTILIEIINGSKEELKDLLDYSCHETFSNGIKNDKNIQEKIYKLIISNFIRNAKYIPSIENILKENNIKLKNIKDYDFKECKKILSLLSDIVFCQRGKRMISELFENINDHLEEYLKRKEKSKSKKTMEYHKKKYIDLYIHSYDIIFKTYRTRKEYIRYFS